MYNGISFPYMINRFKMVTYALVGEFLPAILIVEDSGSGELSEKNNSEG